MFDIPSYEFEAKVWLWAGKSAWYFVTMPEKYSNEIQENFKHISKMGMVPVLVAIGKTEWKTSIWYTKRDQAYLLPLKKSVREKINISDGNIVRVIVKPILSII